ncbi:MULTISPECIES: type II toxin-antitoxin system PemK/MazF family toxin [unclassified Gordonia (in: high G+C Gram-positive bacteria)]
MIRGEIWTVAGGVYASKPRPAVIIQDDLFDSTLSVLIAPMTSRLIEAPLFRIRIPSEREAISGLERDSDVMVDKLTAVRRSNVLTRVGRLTSEQLVEVERSLMAFLGLAR